TSWAPTGARGLFSSIVDGSEAVSDSETSWHANGRRTLLVTLRGGHDRLRFDGWLAMSMRHVPYNGKAIGDCLKFQCDDFATLAAKAMVAPRLLPRCHIIVTETPLFPGV